MSEVSFMLLNTRGLKNAHQNIINNKPKIKILENYIKANKIDIAILTESHDPSPSIFQFGSAIIQSPSRYHGITIVNYNKQINIKKLYEKQGRVLLFKVEMENKSLTILALYAPAGSSKERNSFFEQFLPDNPSLSPDIILGDFNTILRKQDRSDQHKFKLQQCAKTLLHKISSCNLHDVALVSKCPTHTFRQGETTTRIDLVFCTNKTLQEISRFETINPPDITDHAAITFKMNSPQIIKNPSLNTFKIPKTFYNDHARIERVREKLKQWIPLLDPITNWSSLKVYLENELRTEITPHNKQRKKDQKILEKEQQIKSPDTLLKKENMNNTMAACKEITSKRKLRNTIWTEEKLVSPCATLTNILKGSKTKENLALVERPTKNDKTYILSEMVEEAHRHFTSQYNDQHTSLDHVDKLYKFWNFKIDPNDKKEIGESIDLEEVMETLSSLKRNSSPGPDKITNEIYIIFKRELAPHLTKFFHAVQMGGKIPKELKKGIVTTIYKGKGFPGNFSNRRPITLLNNDYKIFSAVINNRLLKILPKGISPTQTGFVPGRLISDNIITLTEIMKRAPKSVIGLLDIEKAFDSLSHKCINRVLKRIDIPKNIRHIIKQMLKHSTVQVLVNRSLTPQISILRGVKQGDPLSPSLFVLCIELLGRALTTIKGVTIQGTRITSLMYADDTAIVAETSSDLKAAEKIIDQMTQASNLKINKSKCVAIPSFLNLLTKKVDSFPWIENKERYLGVYLNGSGIDYDKKDILNKTFSLLARTKHIAKTLETKITLLKTYSLSKLNFLASFVDVEDAASEIEKTIDWFLYTNNAALRSQKARKLLSFEREQMPKQEGGLGRWDMKKRIQCYKAVNIENILHNEPIFKDWWISDITKWLSLQPIDRRKSQLNHSLSIKSLKCWLKANNSPNSILTSYQRLMEIKNNISQNKRKLKALYASPDHRIIITKNQNELATLHNFEFPKIWTIINKAASLRKDKNILRRFLQNTLRYAKGSNCPLCPEQKLNKKHIFFECKKNQFIKKFLQMISSKWSAQVPPWTFDGILSVIKLHRPLTQAIYLSLFGIVWRDFNKQIYNIENENTDHQNTGLIRNAISKVVRYHHHKLKYQLIKAKTEKRAEILTIFTKRWIDNCFVTLNNNRIKINSFNIN